MTKNPLRNKPQLTEAELAEYWGVTKSSLQKWRCAGIGPVYVKLGGGVKYKWEDILEYEKSRRFQGTAKRLSQGK